MFVLLHKRVLLDILKGAKAQTPAATAALDALPQCSHNLLLATEESIASLYSPQDPSVMRSALVSLQTVVADLKTVLYVENFLGSADADVKPLEQTLAEVSVGASPRQKKTPDVRKWFDTCFDQIHKLSQTTLDSFDVVDANS